MKKKILSFLLVFLFVFPLMFFAVGCGQNPGGDPPTGGGGNSPSGDGGGTTTPVQDTISTLYDLRITYYKPASAYTYNYYGGALIWLPDGKTMLIDPVITEPSDFSLFYDDFTSFLKYDTTTNKRVIDYLVVTTENEIVYHKWFWNDFLVKNYYRPDIEVDLDLMVEPSYTQLFDLGLEKEEFYGVSEENLEGRSLEYFDTYWWDEQDPDNHKLCFGYDYNYSYIASLVYAEKQGANIIKTTNNSDISTTMVYKGNQYKYTIDFNVPESKVTADATDFRTYKAGPTGETVMLQNNCQSSEYATILSIEYQGFDALYFNNPTTNIFSSMLQSIPQNKKYDLLIGNIRENSLRNNLKLSILENVQDYQNEYDRSVMSYIFDSSKVETNYFLLNTGDLETNTMWNGLGGANYVNLFIYNYPDSQERFIIPENTLIPIYQASGYGGSKAKINIPVITTTKDGNHTLKKFEDEETLFLYFGPTVDGVIIKN